MASLDNFTDEIASMIDDSLDVDKKLEEVLVKYAEKIIDDIKANAPVGKSKEHLKDSFISLKEGSGKNLSVTIYSKTKSRIVHLVELGFVHRSGVYVKARPFMRNAYEKYKDALYEEIKEVISSGNK